MTTFFSLSILFRIYPLIVQGFGISWNMEVYD